MKTKTWALEQYKVIDEMWAAAEAKAKYNHKLNGKNKKTIEKNFEKLGGCFETYFRLEEIAEYIEGQ